jgi:hypothetical protein
MGMIKLLWFSRKSLPFIVIRVAGVMSSVTAIHVS